MIGKTISGYVFGFTWSLSTNKNGEVEYNHIDGTIYKGKMWIERDAVCLQYEKRFDGIKTCSDIYRNPEGDDKKLSGYLLLSDWWLSPFSVQE